MAIAMITVIIPPASTDMTGFVISLALVSVDVAEGSGVGKIVPRFIERL
jgi:hypothetical protein